MPHSLASFAVDVFRLGVWLVLLAVIFVPLERWFALRTSRVWRPGMATDLGYYFLSSLLPAVLMAVPLALAATAFKTVVPAPFYAAVAALPLWLRIVLAFVIAEIGFYWGHRLSHEWRWMWRFHAVHHSAEHMDFMVNTRAHPVDMVFTKLVGIVPLYALGLSGPNAASAAVPAIVIVIGTIWGFFIHANLRWRLGWFESVLATPAFHHWHHTRTDHIDRNYASMLPVMDRVFGTWYLPRKWPAEYGTDTPVAAPIHRQIIDPLLGSEPPRASARSA